MRSVKGFCAATVCNMVAPAGKNGKLLILLYHRVLEKTDPLRLYDIEKFTFDWHMQLLSEYFNPLSLSDAIEYMEKGNIPPKSVVVTFDDGYADNCEIALPILKKWGVPATVFVATDYLNGGIMWNDAIIESVRQYKKNDFDLSSIGLGKYSLDNARSRYSVTLEILAMVKYFPNDERANAIEYIVNMTQSELPENLMMTTDQLKYLRKSGVDIGGHTCSHPILANISKEQSIQEIVMNKKILEEIVGYKVKLFAYPNGKSTIDYTADHVDIVKSCGYAAAVTTNWGVAKQSTDSYQLPRICVSEKTPFKMVMRLAKAYFDA